MNSALIAGEYLWWQYEAGLVLMFEAWMNVQWFLLHFFSVPELARSLFAPFHRMREQKKQGFDLEDIFEVFAVNILMRVVGALVRLVFISAGLVVQVGAFVIGFIVVAAALLSPIAIPALFISGVWMIVF
ncbi:MAG: hypothetical protein EXS68_00570 [Candidatus Ryanbacteria bacterium]|nr:hypothetical protein [Candidatus Ryanbacteria bacterium]